MKRIFSVLMAASLAASTPLAFADTEDSFNARFNPIGLAIGAANLRLDYKIGEQWVLGPSILFWNLDVGDIKLKAVGAAANAEFFFDQAYTHGWMMDGTLGFVDISVEDDTGTAGAESTDVSAMTGSVIGGYHWFWGTTFNLALGAGLSFNTIGNVKTKNASGAVVDEKDVSPVGLALEANLGFTF